MKVFVTGGTGFTGSHVVSLLLNNGHQVRCLHRPFSDHSLLVSAIRSKDSNDHKHLPGGRSPAPVFIDLPRSEIEWVEGDVSNIEKLSSSMQGMEALVNLTSLGLGHADAILHAARNAGLRRAIFISTTAIFTRLNAGSRQVRVAAEQSIRASGLQYTILRPTMIYGSPRDRNMWRLIRFMRISPIVPVFGSGNSLQQPIYVGDVARAVVACLSKDGTSDKTYNLAGKDPLTYNEVIDTIARKLNKRIWKLHAPSKPVVHLLTWLEHMSIPFPVKAEQVLRLNENKSFIYDEAQRDFGFSPMSFTDGIERELRAK